MAKKNSSAPSLIGVIHLPPLPGSPGTGGRDPLESFRDAGMWAVAEAKVFERAGFDALIVENFGDAPFYKTRVPPETIASMSVILAALQEATRLPIGLNLLRNDAPAALAIAAVTGCHFIRVNVLSGVVATDQGLIEGEAAFLLRERQRLLGDKRWLPILADVHVKHAQTLSSVDLAQATADAIDRGGADAVIVSGAGTGLPTDFEKLARAVQVARAHGAPCYVGSGARPEDLAQIRKLGAGVIVSSALRRGGKAGAPLDSARVRRFTQAWKKASSKR